MVNDKDILKKIKTVEKELKEQKRLFIRDGGYSTHWYRMSNDLREIANDIESYTLD